MPRQYMSVRVQAIDGLRDDAPVIQGSGSPVSSTTGVTSPVKE